MSIQKILAAATVAGFLSTAANSALAAKPAEVEKCYGIAKAGKNDCGNQDNACSAQTTRDNDPDAWIYVLKGTCRKIVGGSTTPSASGTQSN